MLHDCCKKITALRSWILVEVFHKDIIDNDLNVEAGCGENKYKKLLWFQVLMLHDCCKKITALRSWILIVVWRILSASISVSGENFKKMQSVTHEFTSVFTGNLDWQFVCLLLWVRDLTVMDYHRQLSRNYCLTVYLQ